MNEMKPKFMAGDEYVSDPRRGHDVVLGKRCQPGLALGSKR